MQVEYFPLVGIMLFALIQYLNRYLYLDSLIALERDSGVFFLNYVMYATLWPLVLLAILITPAFVVKEWYLHPHGKGHFWHYLSQNLKGLRRRSPGS